MKADGIANQAGSVLTDAGERRACTLVELLVAIAIIGILSGRCIGQTYDGFGYSVSGTNITITNYTGSGGAVTIPSSIPGVNGTVTAIGNGAFAGGGLTSVTIPSSVAAIGNGAFYECTGLTNVTLPSGVTFIGTNAFEWCIGLTSVIIPGSVTAIGNGAFSECTSLTSVTIPSGVTAIGDLAFFECSLSSVTIPGSVTNIGRFAFENCLGLTSVTIGNGVTSIGGGVFNGCSGLSSVTVPASVTNLGGGAFVYCSGLTAITVDAQNPAYSSLGGVLFDKNQTTLVEWPPGDGGAYTIPSSVTAIGGGAFFRCSGLTGVTIPSSVTSIGGDAFLACGLSSVTIPASVISIGSAAFSQCGSLTSITIPGSVTSIGDLAFYDCSDLSSVTMDNGVTLIGAEALQGCSGLTSITIPGSVTSIGDYAFEGCSGLTNAYFQGNAPSAFGLWVFSDTAPNFSIYYPSTASGWSTPTWQGYPAQPYSYTPPVQPVLTLVSGLGTVTPSFTHLMLGTNYQLQVSTDLSTWSNTGPVFTATNASAAYPQPFGTANWRSLFFRLVSAP